VYVGCDWGKKNLCCIGQGSLKYGGSISKQVIDFLDVF